MSGGRICILLPCSLWTALPTDSRVSRRLWLASSPSGRRAAVVCTATSVTSHAPGRTGGLNPAPLQVRPGFILEEWPTSCEPITRLEFLPSPPAGTGNGAEVECEETWMHKENVFCEPL